MILRNISVSIALAGNVLHAWEGKVHEIRDKKLVISTTESATANVGETIYVVENGVEIAEGWVEKVFHTSIHARLIRGTARKGLIVTNQFELSNKPVYGYQCASSENNNYGPLSFSTGNIELKFRRSYVTEDGPSEGQLRIPQGVIAAFGHNARSSSYTGACVEYYVDIKALNPDEVMGKIQEIRKLYANKRTWRKMVTGPFRLYPLEKDSVQDQESGFYDAVFLSTSPVDRFNQLDIFIYVKGAVTKGKFVPSEGASSIRVVVYDNYTGPP